ncbi:MAG: DNA polymerase/3'-5' exonuclease PolX [Bacteroidetes bacterium]|nr:DNA polymerase/3'-5' exonuclease PolX [Bacteroidota bacterium]
MENREIAKLLSETAKLMELHDANEFKIRSYQNASFSIGKTEIPLTTLSLEALSEVKGIGKSLSQKIFDLIHSGVLHDYDKYLSETPPGVVEMMRVKGIGPKKVALLWKQLGLESTGELLYACNENRLIELKGFGSKTQDQIKSAIEYSISNKGFFHYAALEPLALELLKQIINLPLVLNASLTGAIRRKCEVVTLIEVLVATLDKKEAIQNILKCHLLSDFVLKNDENGDQFINEQGVKIKFYFCSNEQFAHELLLTTGNDIHLNKLKENANFKQINETAFESEMAFYASLGMQFIEPELREGYDEIEKAQNNALPDLINFSDLKGALHNHSTYSDGINTLREMAVACKELGYEYLGICDHSKSAFYANGLSEDRIKQQFAEINLLNTELAPFTIFKGIESDILNDGSLDYANDFLKEFDFIVASVHSVLKMSEEKATARLIKAIENPYTSILGHPTGRLLLARKGYPIDHKKVIDACAQNNVVIELNAHPYRLDLDWRWIRFAIEKNVKISINPDAHKKEGYHDMYFGVCVARKGMLTKSMTFNTLNRNEIAAWFKEKKSTADKLAFL